MLYHHHQEEQLFSRISQEMEACNGNDFCRNMLQAAGDTKIAYSVFDQYKMWISQKALLANKPPTFSQPLPKRIQVTALVILQSNICEQISSLNKGQPYLSNSNV